ncbi:MAG: hypothetical protein WC889_12165 [Myxococcota bacterium]|jgi:murein L,D-transpeptidase YafK
MKRLILIIPLLILAAPPASAGNISDPEQILTKVDSIIKADAEKWCRDKGVSWPPDAVVLRIFKKERELEIWGKNDGQAHMVLLKTLPVCSMDFEPGPKLQSGDGKTPEGFYHPAAAYGSRYYWMWMNLDDVDAKGVAGKGSSFKMCTEYPNALDRARSKSAGFSNPGGEICIHGNCVTAGCPSFKNRDFLPVFSFSRHHSSQKYGKLQMHIFPFRFEKTQDWSGEADNYRHGKTFGKAALIRFWKNLEQGYQKFNLNPNPLDVTEGTVSIQDTDGVVSEKGYVFR